MDAAVECVGEMAASLDPDRHTQSFGWGRKMLQPSIPGMAGHVALQGA